MRKLHFATESLAEYRRNLAISTGNISRSLAVLSGSEENSALSGAIAQLSTVQEKIEQIHYEQATADFYYLSELIKDYIGLVGAVKDVFQVIKGGMFLEVKIFRTYFNYTWVFPPKWHAVFTENWLFQVVKFGLKWSFTLWKLSKNHDLEYFETCHFQVIWCLIFGGKIQMWSKSLNKVWLLKNVPLLM